MQQKLVAVICGSVILAGCSSMGPIFSEKEAPATVQNQERSATKPEAHAKQEGDLSQPHSTQQPGPPELIEAEYGYWVYEHEGRIYVVGQASTNHAFRKSGHLPYTRTILGAGPDGETVVFEVDKKDPQVVERLQATYLNQPLLVEGQTGYWVYEHKGRLYVVGQPSTKEQFQQSGHLPYTRTILGAGPNGETVVFEVDKGDPRLVERLQSTFLEQPLLLEWKKNYWVYEHKGRHYVVGQASTNEQFRKSGHLPYTRTILGAGPDGETVVFEVNKKDPQLVERLVNTYSPK